MASDDVGNLLNAGIQAAKAGKKAEARRLLEQVLERDDNNEVAWMWFASVVDTPRERRICLENVLEINPNNRQAREALERLGPLPGTGPLGNQPKSELVSTVRPVSSPRNRPAQPSAAPSKTVERPSRPVGNRPRRRRPLSPTILIGGMVLALVLIVIGFLMATNTLTLVPPTPTNAAVVVGTGTIGAAAAATPTSALPTLTPNATFVGITTTAMVTFTPRPTSTSAPLVPSPTLNLDNFMLNFVGEGRGRSVPGIYTLKGDGTGETLIVKGDEAAFDLSFGANGKMVYVTQVEGADQIATADVDGGNPVVLTKEDGAKLHTPVWSPDGKRIAYVSDKSKVNQIYLMNADGSKATPLTEGTFESRDPSWSPDGSKLIYASDPIGKKTLQLFVLDLAANKSTQLLMSAGSTYSPVWSPDGKQLAFVSTRDRYPNIYVMNLTDKAPRLVSVGGGTATNRDPAWSPDGQYIVFASDRSGGIFNLFVVTADGKNLKQITKSKDNTYGAQFRPSAS